MRSKSTTMPKKPSPPSAKELREDARKSKPSEPLAWAPEPYMMSAAQFMVSRGSAGLFLEPGLRKTSITLAALKVLRKKKLVQSVVVVAPPRVCRSTWPAEVAKWKDFADMRVVNLHGLKKEKLLDEEADIYLVSYNSLDWLFGVTKTKSEKTGKVTVSLNYERFNKLGANCLVLDEGSKARNPNSLTFKILKEAREHFDRIYVLTGSPAPRSLLDLFGLMYLIDGGYSLGAYITHYRAAYFTPTGYGGFDYKLNPGADKLIAKRIAPFVFRLDAKDYVKLPQLIENVVKVELPEKARAVYDKMEKEFFVELEGHGVAAVNGGSSYGKCRQIANGGLFKTLEVDEDGHKLKVKREWFELHQEKAEAVADLIEELQGAPALVVYDFQHDLDRLLKVLGPKTPVMGGARSSPKEGDRIIAAWNKNELPVVLVHAQAMAHGLNMQEGQAQHVLWHSLTDNRELYDQLVARIRRSGNKAAQVFSHLFVAVDTVDELMLKRSSKKFSTQKSLTDDLRDYTLQRRPKLRK